MATANTQSSDSLFEPRKNGSVERGFVSDSIAAGVIFALVLTVGQRFIGFGRGVLFCRLMTEQELGQWSMVWSYLMLLAPLTVLGLPGCFGKFTEHYRQRGQLKTFIGRIAAISFAMTCLMSGLIVIFPTQISWILFRDTSQSGLVQLLGGALIVVSASNFLASLMESLCQVRTVTIMRFITGTMFAIVGTGILMVWDDGASAATLAFAISCLAGMLPACWVMWKCRAGIRNGGDLLTQSTMWKRVAPFAMWMWATNLVSNLIEVSDRYMLLHWSNLSPDLAQGSVGQYHSGRVVPLLMVSVATMVAGVLIPYLSRAWEAGNKPKLTKQLNWTVKIVSIGFTTGGILVLLLSPLLFNVILQGRYNGGLSVLPLTLVYCIWFGLSTVAQDYLWVAEKGKWATLIGVAGLVVNILLNMILIPLIGLPGAVIGTACGNATLVVLVIGLNHRFGCRSDTGIWLCAAIPLILLLNTPLAVLAMVAVLVFCVFSDWILSVEEKSDLKLIFRKNVGKFLPVK